MLSKLKSFTKEFSYIVLYNLFSMFVSGMLIFLVPKFVDVSQYGYWQLYVLYSSYSTYLSFGITEGVYLRYGGEKYSNLPKTLFSSQFWLLTIFELVITLSMAITYLNTSSDVNKTIVISLVSIVTFIIIPRAFLSYTLQATGQIDKFIIGHTIERSLYFIMCIGFLLLGAKKFEVLVFADIIGKLASIIYFTIICRDMVFIKVSISKRLFNEIKDNLSAGAKLLFANLSDILIVGIIRFAIEHSWGIEMFGKVSLTLSISNMILSFFSAISIVLFPMLRRISKESLKNIYLLMNRVVTISSLGLLILYFPLKYVLLYWLPSYSNSMVYMGFLLPICVYESKVTLLMNTYLKNLRKEKELLYINIVTVILSIITSYINTVYLRNIDLMVISIVFLLSVRSIIAELYVSKLLNIIARKEIILEVVISFSFILLTWHFKEVTAFIIYLMIYIIYLLIKRKDIFLCVQYIKRSLK